MVEELNPENNADVNNTSTLEQTLQQAITLHQADQLEEAGEHYLSILHNHPDYPEANYGMGMLAVQMQQPAAGLPYFIAALNAAPACGQYWLSYIEALLQAGQPQEAHKILAVAQQQGLSGDPVEALVARLEANAQAAKQPDTAPALLNSPQSNIHTPAPQQVYMLIDLFQRGRNEEIVALALTMTNHFPLYGFGWKALGAALNNLGKNADALPAMQQAAKLLPSDAETHNNLASLYQDMGLSEKAEDSYRQALQLDPGYAQAYSNLGTTLCALKRMEEAETSYRQALQIKPDLAEAYFNLGNLLVELGRLMEAEASFRRAIQFKPDYADAHNNLGNLLIEFRRLVEAEKTYRRVLEIDPDYAEAHQNLATTLAYLSTFDEVITESDAAIRLKPGSSKAWEQRLYTFSYHPDLSVEEIYKEFVRWGDRFPDPVTDFSTHDRTPGRRLRIGYISPDFRRHTSRFFFWPLFAHHDRVSFELYAYSNVQFEDEFTAEFKELFEHWRNIRGVADEEAARMIREDKIDILVDGCNHMRDERLGVFALKPAPVQATWLGSVWTSGLKTMDYMLTDPYMAPEGTLARENIMRLPHSYFVYHPPKITADIVPPPCLKNGYVTFGYSGRTERLNHHTFRVWGEILQRIPDARLILDFRTFEDPPTQEHYRQFMAKHGMNPDRVIMRNSANIFSGLNDFDILLDSFPHNGGTMLIDALWMGVPALTLAGRPTLGRIGACMLMNLEMPGWVADSEDEYIEKACAFASDPQLLAQLRSDMRERMQNSPLMDEPGFTRAMEAAYREMFEKWAKG